MIQARVFLLTLPVAACGAGHAQSNLVPGEVGDVEKGQAPPFKAESTGEPAFRHECQPRPPMPELHPHFAPAVSGDLSLVSGRGDVRAWMPPSGNLWVRAPDASFVAVAEWGGAIAVWRSHDGTLDDLVTCPGGALYPVTIAISPDQRWIVVSGTRSMDLRNGALTCIVDRQSHKVRVVAGEISYPNFDLASGVVIGRNRGIHLQTGANIRCEEMVGLAARSIWSTRSAAGSSTPCRYHLT